MVKLQSSKTVKFAVLGQGALQMQPEYVTRAFADAAIAGKSFILQGTLQEIACDVQTSTQGYPMRKCKMVDGSGSGAALPIVLHGEAAKEEVFENELVTIYWACGVEGLSDAAEERSGAFFVYSDSFLLSMGVVEPRPIREVLVVR